jgi:hypothetical protein
VYDDEPEPNWQWHATCPPCQDYLHDDCWGRDPALTWLCVCDLDRCLPTED